MQCLLLFKQLKSLLICIVFIICCPRLPSKIADDIEKNYDKQKIDIHFTSLSWQFWVRGEHIVHDDSFNYLCRIFNLKACSPEDRSFHPQISTHTQQYSWSQGGPASDWNSLCLLLLRWVPYIVFRVLWTVKNESLRWIREYVLVVIETYFIALKLNLAHFLVWYILYNSIFGGRAVIS